MTVHGVRGDQKVTCELVGQDGSRTPLGSFDLVGGSGSWGAPDPCGAHRHHGAWLVGSNGQVIATAAIPLRTAAHSRREGRRGPDRWRPRPPPPPARGPAVRASRQRAEQGSPTPGSVRPRRRRCRRAATPRPPISWPPGSVPGWPTLGSSLASEITRGGIRPMVVWRHPAISSTVRFGTLRLTTTAAPPGPVDNRAHHRAGHGRGPVPHLTGEHLVPALALDPEAPDRLADRHPADAAGPGREGGADRAGVVHRPPTLMPGLMPATTRSNGGPNAPRRANMTHRAGGPVTAQAQEGHRGGPGALPAGCGAGRPGTALAPEYSSSGATTVTEPCSVMARARTWRPSESMPSSLVTRIRTARCYHAGVGPRVSRPPGHVPPSGRPLAGRP